MTVAASSAGGGMRFAFDSCLSECDCGINRRPYHRNCGCALHKSKSRECSLKASESSNSSGERVSFPIRRSWSEGCLALTNFASSRDSSGLELIWRRKAWFESVDGALS